MFVLRGGNKTVAQIQGGSSGDWELQGKGKDIEIGSP